MSETEKQTKEIAQPSCEDCGAVESLGEYDGELLCGKCIREAMDYEEGQLFVRDMLHNK